MLEKLRARMGSEKGFTLIELLIVIVILGILAAIVVFAVGAFTNEGKTTACNADAKNVEIAQEAHKARNGGTAAASVAELVTEGYLKEAPASASCTSGVPLTS